MFLIALLYGYPLQIFIHFWCNRCRTHTKIEKIATCWENNLDFCYQSRWSVEVAYFWICHMWHCFVTKDVTGLHKVTTGVFSLRIRWHIVTLFGYIIVNHYRRYSSFSIMCVHLKIIIRLMWQKMLFLSFLRWKWKFFTISQQNVYVTIIM